MKIQLVIILLLDLGLLVACSEMNSNPMAMDQSVTADHEAQAKYYEEIAEKKQRQVNEQQKLLSQYELKSYLYGRQAEDIKAHSEALINAYERAVVENRKMAQMHRAMTQQ